LLKATAQHAIASRRRHLSQTIRAVEVDPDEIRQADGCPRVWEVGFHHF
jgi:hypothetical protein